MGNAELSTLSPQPTLNPLSNRNALLLIKASQLSDKHDNTYTGILVCFTETANKELLC